MEILDVNTRGSKFYVLFTTDEHAREYLYFQDKTTGNRSLLVGSNIGAQYFNAKKTSDCIECGILDIIGGITQEREEVIEYRLERNEANEVIKQLQKEIEQERLLLFE